MINLNAMGHIKISADLIQLRNDAIDYFTRKRFKYNRLSFE